MAQAPSPTAAAPASAAPPYFYQNIISILTQQGNQTKTKKLPPSQEQVSFGVFEHQAHQP
jgi:hypothetical protein